ncbi:hypothetical protein [Deinococcus peraridilitoris]|uniref:Uncharacterized protein n=1 Tax=Deinococcus peraridilitoris (strain DSM 19664 / LMG 22246 / CIP 109416 / KR-200) TaxID=937777 RepID=K9ZZJ3_DEIPD|nr:hypothetical protein [Deinococcus peraridilitoris]AFZ67063.1 hypothetical protein Deipe_1522 [Deinococcus peraridilitoris DSM 19664]
MYALNIPPFPPDAPDTATGEGWNLDKQDGTTVALNDTFELQGDELGYDSNDELEQAPYSDVTFVESDEAPVVRPLVLRGLVYAESKQAALIAARTLISHLKTTVRLREGTWRSILVHPRPFPKTPVTKAFNNPNYWYVTLTLLPRGAEWSFVYTPPPDGSVTPETGTGDFGTFDFGTRDFGA